MKAENQVNSSFNITPAPIEIEDILFHEHFNESDNDSHKKEPHFLYSNFEEEFDVERSMN